MRLVSVVLVLVFAGVCLTALEAGARPVKGNKTVSLEMTGFSYDSITERQCDGDGSDCDKIGKATEWDLGIGMSGGYLLTDMIELGISAGLNRSSYHREDEDTDGEAEYSDWGLTGHGYGKLHLGSAPKVVPFLAGGIGLDLTWGRQEETYGYDFLAYGPLADYETDTGTLAFNMFAEGGIDYYIGDKYAITGSLRVSYSGFAWDWDTDTEENDIYGQGIWSMRVGLGVATYF